MVRVALLTNILPHYRVPLLEALQERVGELRIFLSSRTERDRNWRVYFGKLDVVVQRSMSWTRNFRNVHGYRDTSHIHVPYDTLAQLGRYRPQVIVSGEFGSRTLMSTVYRITHSDTILIVWATLSDHTEATRGRLRGALRRWIVSHADGILVNGASGARYIRSLGFAGPIFNVPYVVDNAAFSGDREPPDAAMARHGTTRLFYAGQLIERKGLHQFLPVLSRWCYEHPDRRISMRLAGNGPERERLQAIEVPDNLEVEWMGDFPPERLPGYYLGSDIFVFPTLGDEWGTVVNEALSAGVPVLGSVFSQAVEELIREGENGWLFRPTDAEDTYLAIDRALTSSVATLDRMSVDGRKSIAGLTPEIVAARMADAIEALAKA